ncbi:glycoprotein 3-alpha-L-fucosyltransferase A-like isoform X1 [Haliotis rufescens]|uniref:glycoprotein 3-alpha-L-fucosyltransferase A-like isoform X1 n=1 Tax=Haliotis rufescens TaxID=6454 RepID=UPI00201E829B|nr:glycoprotein 3-alpha-L-fucosyltransferase A-like isoform X1 [Haliotis rufescens]
MTGLRQLKTLLVHPLVRRGAAVRFVLLVCVGLVVVRLLNQSNHVTLVNKTEIPLPKTKAATTLKPRVVLPGGVKDESELFKVHHESEWGIPNYALVVEKVKKVVYKPIKAPTKVESVKKRPLKRFAWLNTPTWMVGEAYTDFSQCAVSDCVMSLNRSDVPTADVVLVHIDLLKDTDVPNNNPDQIWAFYTAEIMYQFVNPRPIQRADWIGRFNWTVSFRLDSDAISTYSRLILKDGFVDTANYTDIVLRKTRSVLWFVSHCDTQSKRKEYVEELRKYIDVDIYGQCGNLTCEEPQCKDLWGKYFFYLSFENSLCKDYVTEKFFNTFNKQIVPVVRGGADYRTLFPPDLNINTADFPSPRALAEHLKALKQDLPGYTKILRNMAKYDQGGNFLKGIPYICEMCAKINKPLVRKRYTNIYRWWTEGICFEPKDISK